ncbi:MAG: hypothetical protein RLZZ26_444 [Candidatus Parcubacteria bacterium]
MAKTLTVEEGHILEEARRVLKGEVVVVPEYLTGKNVGSRYIETLWTAAHLKGAQSILDIGFSLASLEYLGMLLALKEQNIAVAGVDIINPQKVQTRYPNEWLASILEVPVTVGDVRTLLLPENMYDVVTCVSTIEHIGYDAPSSSVKASAFERPQTKEEVVTNRDPQVEADVLKSFHRALKTGGRALITVPMGRGGPVILRDSLGLYCVEWEYETKSWLRLRQAEGFIVEEELFFKNTPSGWAQVLRPEDLSDVTEEMVPGQGVGVALIALRKK